VGTVVDVLDVVVVGASVVAVVGDVSVATVLLSELPVVQPNAPRTTKAATTHDTIWAPSGQLR